VPLQITVSKDFLTPWEQQLAGEINSLNLPVHVELAPAPLPLPLPSMPVAESITVPPDAVSSLCCCYHPARLSMLHRGGLLLWCSLCCRACCSLASFLRPQQPLQPLCSLCPPSTPDCQADPTPRQLLAAVCGEAG
jgi:hypothetical protein